MQKSDAAEAADYDVRRRNDVEPAEAEQHHQVPVGLRAGTNVIKLFTSVINDCL